MLNFVLSTVGQIGTMLVEGKGIGENIWIKFHIFYTLPLKRESLLL